MPKIAILSDSHDNIWSLDKALAAVRAADADVLLSIHRHAADWNGTSYSLTPTTQDPLLVVRETRHSRSAALTTDLAPHWVGPLVDWGSERVTAQHPPAEGIEVGSLYVQFIEQLVGWLCEPRG